MIKHRLCGATKIAGVTPHQTAESFSQRTAFRDVRLPANPANPPLGVVGMCVSPAESEQRCALDSVYCYNDTWQCVKTNSTPGEHQNSWDLWMFIPLKMVLIGIDPYPLNYTDSLYIAPSDSASFAWKLHIASLMA